MHAPDPRESGMIRVRSAVDGHGYFEVARYRAQGQPRGPNRHAVR